jgi:hypothetical protein
VAIDSERTVKEDIDIAFTVIWEEGRVALRGWDRMYAEVCWVP